MEEGNEATKIQVKKTGRGLIRASMILSLTAVITYVDYVTGYQRPIIALYGLPIALITWYYGSFIGNLLAILSVFAWGWADIASGHPYDSELVFVLNAANCLAYFLTIVISVHFASRNMVLVRRLQRAFSGEISICTQCARIRSPDDTWNNFESYLREHSHATIKHKVCPTCARGSYAHPQAPPQLFKPSE